MEFKEFENPEQNDYDVKVGANAPTFTPHYNNDDMINTDEGIDLNALGDEPFSMPQVSGDNGNFTINEFGEIIRDFSFSPTISDLEDVPIGKSR